MEKEQTHRGNKGEKGGGKERENTYKRGSLKMRLSKKKGSRLSEQGFPMTALSLRFGLLRLMTVLLA